MLVLTSCLYEQINKEETHSQFLTANGTSIKCFGITDLEIDIGFGKATATFHICAIEQPILGFHFMHQNQLTLDAKSSSLRCLDTEMKVNNIPMPVNTRITAFSTYLKLPRAVKMTVCLITKK